MSSFTKPLCVKVLENGKHYEVLEDFTYYTTSNKHRVFKVEKGFITVESFGVSFHLLDVILKVQSCMIDYA